MLRNPPSGTLIQRGVATLSGGVATIGNVQVGADSAILVTRGVAGTGVVAGFPDAPSNGIKIQSSGVENIPVYWCVIP